MNDAFIVFEGPEGGGKTVQTQRLAASLDADGHPVLLTREPGGTGVGEAIRGLLLESDDAAMFAQTEALLMSAARAQHVHEVILPARASGKTVICDRFIDSTFAYQGGGRGLDLEALIAIQHFATGGLQPDLKLLLDLPVEVGLRRRHTDPMSLNRIDLADLAFHQRVRESYIHLARQEPERWVVIDASASPDAVASAIEMAVRERLGLDRGLMPSRRFGSAPRGSAGTGPPRLP